MSPADRVTSYQLAPALVALLERLARAWGVRPDEALERAVRASAERLGASTPTPPGERHDPTDDRVALLRRLQAELSLDAEAAAAWATAVREERHASRRPTPD